MKPKFKVLILLLLIVSAAAITLLANGCFEASVPFSAKSRESVKAYVKANKELVNDAGNLALRYGKLNYVSLRESELTVQKNDEIKIQRFDSGNEPVHPLIITHKTLSEVLKNCQKAFANNETAVFQMGTKRFGSTTWGFYYCDDDEPHGLKLCGDEYLEADGDGWSYSEFRDEGVYIYVERLEPNIFFFYRIY